MAAAAAHVAHQRRGMGVFRLQALHDRRVLPDPAPVLFSALPDALAHGPVAEVAARIHIQQRAEHGHDHDDHQPGDLRRGVKAAVQQDGHHDDVHHDRQRIQMRHELRKPPGGSKQQKQLQKKQQHDDAQTAENHGEQALLALLQQRQTLAFPIILVFHVDIPSMIFPIVPLLYRITGVVSISARLTFAIPRMFSRCPARGRPASSSRSDPYPDTRRGTTFGPGFRSPAGPG